MEEYDEVLELWKIAGLEILAGDEREEISKKLERIPELFLVAESNDRIIGAIMGTWDGRRGWIHHLAISPLFNAEA